MTPHTLAQRIAALDWSGCSLQHQLAVAAAVETLKGTQRDDTLRNRHETAQRQMVMPISAGHTGRDSSRVDALHGGNGYAHARDGAPPASLHQDRGWQTNGAGAIHPAGVDAECSNDDNRNVVALRAPSPELLRGAEYAPARQVTLTRIDGRPLASALLTRADRWDWIVETTCEICNCDAEQVAMDDDTVTVDGMPVLLCC